MKPTVQNILTNQIKREDHKENGPEMLPANPDATKSPDQVDER